MVHLFNLHRLAEKCTKNYNACRTIVRLIKSLVCDVSAADVVCARSQLLWSIKSHDVDLSSFCLHIYMYIFELNLEVIEKFDSKRTIFVFHTGKRLYHLPMEISGNSSRNFCSNGKRPLSITDYSWPLNFRLLSLVKTDHVVRSRAGTIRH